MAGGERRKPKWVKVTDAQKRRFPSKHYVYIINITWDDGSDTVIYRRYSKFFDFQLSLLEKFPKEGGLKDPALRIIPFLPGKILFGRSHVRDVAMKRLRPIDEYCQALVKLPEHISESDHVLEFFETKPEDLNPMKDESSIRKRRKEDSDVNEISGPIILEQYSTVADYKSTQSKELTIFTGQVVEVIEKHENGWWFISNDEGERGWVPGVYLEKLDGSSEDLVINQLEPGQGEAYITTHAYKAENPDEVSFPAGVIVEVLQKNLEGWWKIIFNGVEGYAPASYLERENNWTGGLKPAAEPVKNLTTVKHRHSLPSSTSLSAISHPTLIDTTSSIVAANDLKPVRQDTVPSNYKPQSSSSVNDMKKSFENNSDVQHPPKRRSTLKRSKKPQVPPPLPPVPMSSPDSEYEYMTVADFQANLPDGLSFKSGASIKVIEKSPGGWWYINNGESEGWAPATYIEKRLKTVNSAPGPKLPPKDKITKPPLLASNSAGNLNGNKAPLSRAVGKESSNVLRTQSVISPATRPLPPLPGGLKSQAVKDTNEEIESLRPPPLPPTNTRKSKPLLHHSNSSPCGMQNNASADVDFRSVLKSSISKKMETANINTKPQPTNNKTMPKPVPKPSAALKPVNKTVNIPSQVNKKQPSLPEKPKTFKPINGNNRPNSGSVKPPIKSSKDDNNVSDFRHVLKPAANNKPTIKNGTPANRSKSFNTANTKPNISVRTANGSKKPPKLPQKPPATRNPKLTSSANSSPKASPVRRPGSSVAEKKKQILQNTENRKATISKLHCNNNNIRKSSPQKPTFIVGRAELEQTMPDLSTSYPVRGSPDGQVADKKFTDSKISGSEGTKSNRLSSSSTYSNDDFTSTKLIAIGDYEGIEDCEISFLKGDEAELIDTAANNWWYVNIRNVCGWAPSSFFESQGSADSGFHNESKRNSTADSIGDNSSDTEQHTITGNATPHSDVYSMIEELSKCRQSVSVYKAATSFNASDVSMMSFECGDRMTIGELSEGGWCFATMLDGTAEGWIPFTYIDPE